MDEATWAILLCKDSSSSADHVHSLHEYRDDNHNNLESIQQHITDISNSFMDDGGGHYHSNNSDSSNLSINNNNNTIDNNNFTNTLTKEYQRLGSNGLPLRGSPGLENEEFIDLDDNYNHLVMMNHYNNNNNSQNHHHHPPHQQHHHCNNTSVISLSPSQNSHAQEPLATHHRYTNGDHNHYHLQQNHHHLQHRLNYNNITSAVQPHYNTGSDTSSSNSSTVSLTTAQHNHNNNLRHHHHHHHPTAYSLRRPITSPSPVIRESANEFHPSYMTHHQPSTPYNNNNNKGDQESCSDTDLKKRAIVKEEQSYNPRRRPGRPRGSRRKKPEKLGRLWEFIRDLLLNPESCPSLICWDNYEEGMFRFVRSDKVAKLWGEKRGNLEMNYEKLSRAMRYYYKSNVLLPVYGRRLVYKFGPEARGWQTENPNFTC